jgi:hypothetical protein
MTATTLDRSGRYLGDHQGPRPRLWFEAGTGERTRIETLDRTSPDGPNWGYRGSGPNATAEAILFHATGDMNVVELCGRDLANELIARLAFNQPFELPATHIERWLLDHGVDLTPPWGPPATSPQVRHEPQPSSHERYVIALDGWDIAAIDLNRHGEQARITIADLDATGEPVFDRTVTYAYPDETNTDLSDSQRVGVEVMPFGGWMITADRHDLVIIDRDRGQPDRLRLRICDRTIATNDLALDTTVRHREIPTTGPTLETADRLHQLSRTHPAPGTGITR